MATITSTETEAATISILFDQISYEIIDGNIKELPPMGSYPVALASFLHEYLAPYVRKERLGRAFVEMLFRIDPVSQYKPDVAFVSFERWPERRKTPKKQPWDLIPDLAVEVVSENDKAWEVMAKVAIYFEVGVRAVWLIYPEESIIHVYDSFTSIRVLTRADELDGGALIPGFRLPLTLLFEEDEDPEPDAG